MIADAKDKKETPTLAKVQSENGTPAIEKPKDLKGTEVMIFQKGDIYHGLREVRVWDPELNDYGPSELKQTVLINDQFIDLPHGDADLIDEYGKFLQDYARVIRGLKISKRKGRTINDVNAALELTRKYKV
ncbi:MAG: hypothetical protein FWD92_06190 [Methanomassiliicoccaceae archaeon]|nr:hypothetical protein [Methanomassiliicoccaceae archaeon]